MKKESIPKKIRKSHFLFTPEGKEYLNTHFCNGPESTYSIASEFETYANKVRRAVLYHGLPLKDKSKSQKDALKSGRAKHPTEGTTRPLNTKNKIGDSVREKWADMPEDKLNNFKEKCSKRWHERTPEEQKEFSKKAAKAVRKTAEDGSFFEHQIYTMLKSAGYNVVFHKERIIDYTEMHIDLFIPEYGLAIEVDGPSHFYPIYGEEVLLKRIEADTKKTGVLLSNGYIVLRICDISRYHSASSLREFNGKLLKLIKEIVDNPPSNAKDRYFEIKFGEYNPDKWERRTIKKEKS